MFIVWMVCHCLSFSFQFFSRLFQYFTMLKLEILSLQSSVEYCNVKRL
jgi:hypothetical protein